MISQEDAQQALSAFEPRLAECAHGAMISWMKIPAGLRAAMSPNRTFANVLWSLFRHEAFLEFGGEDGVTLSEKYGTLSLIFSNAVMLRFKHLDARGRTSNFPTQTSLAFYNQIEIPGISAALPRLQLCWREDPMRVGLITLDVAMKVGSVVAWRYPILDEGGVASHPIRANQPKPIEPRLRGKIGNKKRKEGEN
jgi:hypothetical protein